ncbi:MAG: hypothetical protein HN929_06930 [Chloroflexi bacterium]|nr:hypothetical protein [Chloroflexota bacterium]MBT7290847.1 hypothetical protein [Chloroflexota bacterium]
MSIPDQTEIVDALIDELEKAGGTAEPQALIDGLADRFNLTTEEREEVSQSGRRSFDHRVYQAAYMARSKRNALESKKKTGRGKWMLKDKSKWKGTRAVAPKPVEVVAPQIEEVVAKKPMETPIERRFEMPIERPIERHAERPIERPVERYAERHVERPIERPAERYAERHVERPIERPAERARPRIDYYSQLKEEMAKMVFEPSKELQSEMNLLRNTLENAMVQLERVGEYLLREVQIAKQEASDGSTDDKELVDEVGDIGALFASQVEKVRNTIKSTMGLPVLRPGLLTAYAELLIKSA